MLPYNLINKISRPNSLAATLIGSKLVVNENCIFFDMTIKHNLINLWGRALKINYQILKYHLSNDIDYDNTL